MRHNLIPITGAFLMFIAFVLPPSVGGPAFTFSLFLLGWTFVRSVRTRRARKQGRTNDVVTH